MNYLKISLFILLPFLFLNCSERFSNKPTGSKFYNGVDISLLPKLERYGAVYKDKGRAKDALQIFKDHGINCIRLRLFHTPNDSGPVCNSLNYTKKFAKRIKQAGFQFMLDFHYSDTWADPGKQYIPAAWKDLNYEMMKDSIFLYTKTVMTQLKNQNTLPDLVQIGNEIANGMLWDMGRVSGWFESEEQWAKFGGLIKAAIRGLKESLSPKDSVKILIHFDNGASKAKCQHFFDHIILQGIDFDILCVSYYSYWHGSINELRENLAFLASKYKRDIFVVETAYPWATHPQYPLDSTKFTYPATPIGQHSFLKAVKTVVKNIPDNRGKGFFYWAPEWIEVTGWGSPALERLALFDYEGNALPGMEVFKEE